VRGRCLLQVCWKLFASAVLASPASGRSQTSWTTSGHWRLSCIIGRTWTTGQGGVLLVVAVRWGCLWPKAFRCVPLHVCNYYGYGPPLLLLMAALQWSSHTQHQQQQRATMAQATPSGGCVRCWKHEGGCCPVS
jgi:hypothetical protein